MAGGNNKNKQKQPKVVKKVSAFNFIFFHQKKLKLFFKGHWDIA